PLVEVFPKYYLDILANSLSVISSQYKIKVTGGVEAINYLRTKLPSIKKDKIILVLLKHNEFIKELNHSLHFITTAGQTATLEAFALGIPTSFLLPMNLSQLALTDLLSRYDSAPQCLLWNSYVLEKKNDIPATEKDALVLLNVYAEMIKNDKRVYQKLSNDIVRMITNIPNSEGQKKFIDNLGVNGAKIVMEILSKKWDL
ncbi:MAG: hypothetical protein Q7K55_06510, partial [Candidatus Levybacteria bacterium]|nr:hypothetical protein [Candidatus Levybacteria bacterium]